jgi:uncharacterized membrane protein YidH (DUF202 family)
MSWVRTATALIAFSFTIFQFFQRFNSILGQELVRCAARGSFVDRNYRVQIPEETRAAV